MIDLVREIAEYSPVDIKKLSESNPDIDGNLLNSIVLYNKALENIKAHNEDIAVIELKKAVALNPAFYEAQNLLGLCYSSIKEYDKAKDVFRKVMQGENNSIKAMRYMQILDPGSVQGKAAGTQTAGAGAQKKGSRLQGAVNAINNVNVTVLRYIALITIGLLAVLLLAIIAIKGASVLADKKAAKAYKNLDDTAAVSTTAAESVKAERDSLKAELEQIKVKLAAADSELAYNRNAVKLLEAERLYNEARFEETADLLLQLGGAGFKDTAKIKYDNLYAAAIPQATLAVYTEGTNLYYAKNFKEALPKLNKILVYDRQWKYMDWTLYEIGVCYKELNQPTEAAATFKKLIQAYPSSQYAGYAQNRLNEITGQP